MCCLDVDLFDVLVGHGALSVERGDGGLTKGIFTVSAAQILRFVSVGGHCLIAKVSTCLTLKQSPLTVIGQGMYISMFTENL